MKEPRRSLVVWRQRGAGRRSGIGGADLRPPHIGLAEFFRAQAGQQCGENEREISFSPIGLAFWFPILRDSFKECFDRGAGESLGERLGGLRSSGSYAEVFPESDQGPRVEPSQLICYSSTRLRVISVSDRMHRLAQ